jgi:hypothetical protein
MPEGGDPKNSTIRFNSIRRQQKTRFVRKRAGFDAS